MADYLTSKQGAYRCLLEEALPSCASSSQLFANAPDATCKIVVTLRSGGLTVRFDAGAATAQANGVDYPAGTYEFTVSSGHAKLMRAIQYGGTTTGYISYHGLA